MFRNILEKISYPIKALIKGLIKFYQKLISPCFGNKCRFYPSCSQYAYEAIQQHSLFVALWLITKRLLKCQPLHKGGFDPLPKSKN
ncbi:MAG: yidD [Gammaproteobacteria bacterium]|jgi:putative membrane protein insertion efficiency factor|nr:yidD [Gammaproteobacteria bacterium]